MPDDPASSLFACPRRTRDFRNGRKCRRGNGLSAHKRLTANRAFGNVIRDHRNWDRWRGGAMLTAMLVLELTTTIACPDCSSVPVRHAALHHVGGVTARPSG